MKALFDQLIYNDSETADGKWSWKKNFFERENKNLYTTTMIWNLYSDKSVLKLIGERQSEVNQLIHPKCFHHLLTLTLYLINDFL